MIFARCVFWMSGAYGIVVLLPLYFMESLLATYNPPEITHPDFYYGFIGITLAFQVLFLIIGNDPVRYRLAIIPAILEKFSYVGALVMLYAHRRISVQSASLGIPDFIMGTFFIIAWFVVPRRTAQWPN